MNQQSMFPDAIDVMAGDVATNHKARILQVMRLYSERGKTLAEISDSRIMGRSIRTLRKYCAAGKIAFPDWTPRSMRPKRDKKVVAP